MRAYSPPAFIKFSLLVIVTAAMVVIVVVIMTAAMVVIVMMIVAAAAVVFPFLVAGGELVNFLVNGVVVEDGVQIN